MIINCKQVCEGASNYIDGELPLMKRLSIKLHIFICVRCRRYLEQLRSTAAVIAAAKPKEKMTDEAKTIAKGLMEKYQKTTSEY